MSYCPRSSLPADVLAWLAARLAHLLPSRPPGQGGTPPLSLEVRLDAVAAVLLDGLSYRRAARMVGISKTEVGDSMDLLLAELAAIGYCQPDGTFVTTLADLRQWLVEMARAGEAVCVDGLATRVQRPSGWVNQKVLYDAKRHTHTAQGVAVSTIHWDLLWCDGGWPGSCHEHELLQLSGLDQVLDATGVGCLLDRGFRGLAKAREHWHTPIGTAAQDAMDLQPLPGRATRAGGAVDRLPCQRLVAAPLARPAPSDSGRLPGHRRARLPGPVATPDTHMTKHRGHSQNRPVSAAAHLSSASRSASVKASRSALSTSSVPTTMPVPGSTTGTMASDSVLAKAVR